MKIYCSSCDKVQPVLIDDCRDAKTNEPFQDIVCADCHLVIASGTGISSEYERGFIDGMQKQMQSSVDRAVNRMAEQPAQQEKDALAVDQIFKGVPRRKLERLLADGWRINGVSIERTEADGTSRRGAVTGGGMVLWWNQEQPAQQQEPVAWHDKIKGMEVSMDVSTGEDDAHNRIYGRVYEVILEDGEGTPNAILAIEEDRNFTSPPASKPKNVMQVKRTSDQSVELVFTSCAAASEFEAKLREKNA